MATQTWKFLEIPIVRNGVSQMRIRHKPSERNSVHLFTNGRRVAIHLMYSLCVDTFFSSLFSPFSQHQHLQIYFKLKLEIPTANKERKWCTKYNRPLLLLPNSNKCVCSSVGILQNECAHHTPSTNCMHCKYTAKRNLQQFCNSQLNNNRSLMRFSILYCAFVP